MLVRKILYAPQWKKWGILGVGQKDIKGWSKQDDTPPPPPPPPQCRCLRDVPVRDFCIKTIQV
jgi:hypothetical protein